MSDGPVSIATAPKIDSEMCCSNFQYIVKTKRQIKRPRWRCVVHTIHNRLSQLDILDVRCNILSALNPYARHANKRFILTSKLLYSDTCDICGSGRTFRTALAAWSSRNFSPIDTLHRLVVQEWSDRQRCNDAFTALLTKLRISEFPGF